MTTTRLVIRMDDAASCSEANRAIAEIADAGTARCVSVMAVGPALEEAAALLARRTDLEVGLHIAINAEWETIKWRPAAPAEQVPSLVNEQGTFLPWPKDIRERGFSVEEILIEAASQLARLRSLGFRPVYLDEHCGFGDVLGIGEALDQFAAREGLLRVRSVRHVPPIAAASGTGPEQWLARIAAAPSGDYVLVSHPGGDEPGGDMRRFHMAGQPEDGTVARERDAERRTLTDPLFRQTLQDSGVRLVRYSEILNEFKEER